MSRIRLLPIVAQKILLSDRGLIEKTGRKEARVLTAKTLGKSASFQPPTTNTMANIHSNTNPPHHPPAGALISQISASHVKTHESLLMYILMICSHVYTHDNSLLM